MLSRVTASRAPIVESYLGLWLHCTDCAHGTAHPPDHDDVSHGTNRRVVQNPVQVTARTREAHGVPGSQSEAATGS